MAAATTRSTALATGRPGRNEGAGGVPSARQMPARRRHQSPRPDTPVGQLARATLDEILAAGGPRIVYQPQLSLSRLTVVGYEALARFPESPIAGTEQWFGFARARGAGHLLEAAAARQALRRSVRRHQPAGTTIAVNLSPGMLTGAGVAGAALGSALPEDLTGVEVELTEQADHRGSTDRLRAALQALRARGARIAIDDVGAAHSGLRRVIELAPDRLKIDRHLVTGVATNSAKAALIRTIVELAGQTGATVCAEGVETVEDLQTLAELDVDVAQGWLIGLPGAGFAPATPVAVGAAQRSLGAMLSCHPVAGEAADADGGNVCRRLLPHLSAVSRAPDLSRLVAGFAPALGAEMLVLSPLDAGRAAIRALPGLHGRDDASSWYRLADYPTTRRCMQEQVVVPVYAGSTGHPSEWESMDDFGYPSALLVPVVSRGRAVALLECFRKTSAIWSRREIRQARDLAAMIGPALDLALSPCGDS